MRLARPLASVPQTFVWFCWEADGYIPHLLCPGLRPEITSWGSDDGRKKSAESGAQGSGQACFPAALLSFLSLLSPQAWHSFGCLATSYKGPVPGVAVSWTYVSKTLAFNPLLCSPAHETRSSARSWALSRVASAHSNLDPVGPCSLSWGLARTVTCPAPQCLSSPA